MWFKCKYKHWKGLLKQQHSPQIGSMVVAIMKDKRKFLKFLFFIFMIFLGSFFQSQNIQQGFFNPLHEKKKMILIYKVSSKDTMFTANLLRMEYNSNVFMKDQETLYYDYCKSFENCKKEYEKIQGEQITIKHDEITGFTRKSYSIWLHPPRSDYFKILELNAFPYYTKIQDNWSYSVIFGKEWGNNAWKEWDGFRTSTSTYHKIGNESFVIKGEEVSCLKIEAKTNIPELGETTSIFYYNDKYGFVKMVFNTINKKNIEFNLIDIL